MSEVESKPGIELGSMPWKSASVDGYTPLQAAAAFSQRRCLKLNRNQGSWGPCHGTAAGCSSIQPATMSEVESKPGIVGSVPWKSASVDGWTPLQAAAAFSQRRCLKLNRNQGSWGPCHGSQPALTAGHRCRLQQHSASDDV